MDIVSERSFHPGGFLALEAEQNHVTREFVTDGFGRVLQISTMPNVFHPDPVPQQQFGYDRLGNRIWEATRTPDAPYGKPNLSGPPDSTLLSYAEHDYDLTGRVTTERRYSLETGETLTKTFEYDDVNNTVKVTDRNVATTIFYDGRGRLTSTHLPDGSINTIQHNLGWDVSIVQSNSNGNITRIHNYDTRGLLLSTTDSTNTMPFYQATYDDDGNQLTETRRGLGPVSWAYDSFGRLVSESKTVSVNPTTVIATSTYGYDRNNRLTSYADANNSTSTGSPWLMTFTGLDAPLTVTDPLNRLGTYTYATGTNWPRTLPATVSEPNGRVTSYAYDSQARVIEDFNGSCPPDRDPWACNGVLQPQRTTQYLPLQRMKKTLSATRFTVELHYDSLGRVADEIVGNNFSDLHTTVHHQFLDAGRTETTDVAYALGGTSLSFPTMTHRYDNMDRPSTVSLPNQTLATYYFGVGAGGPLSLNYSNGATAQYHYDDRLRQTRIDVTFGTSASVVSLHEALGPDSIPRVRQHQIGSGVARTDVFQVDAAGRVIAENPLLLGVTLPSGETDNDGVRGDIGRGVNWRQYDIDKIGNIAKRTMRDATLIHTIDNFSRLTALGGSPVTHDSIDNLGGSQDDADQFTFDPFTGLLKTASNAGKVSAFAYDALNRRRVEQQPDGTLKWFIWDGNKLVGHGPVNNLTMDVPGDDIDSHIVSIDQQGAGSQWFYHQGPDQSMLAVTGSAGLVEAYTYSAFGEMSMWDANGNPQTTSSFGNIFQFQGQVYDALTQTYSMRARQYRPDWGQFISPDPISTKAGPSLYAFTGSRPLSSRDPLGLLARSDDSKWDFTLVKWGSIPMFGGIEGINGGWPYGDSGLYPALGDAFDRVVPELLYQPEATPHVAGGPTEDAIQDGGPLTADTSYRSNVLGHRRTAPVVNSDAAYAQLVLQQLAASGLGAFGSDLIQNLGGPERVRKVIRATYTGIAAYLVARFVPGGAHVLAFLGAASVKNHDDFPGMLGAVTGLSVVGEAGLLGSDAVFMDALLEGRVEYSPEALASLERAGLDKQAILDAVETRPIELVDGPIIVTVDNTRLLVDHREYLEDGVLKVFSVYFKKIP
jgi:RHS repeat-associated protein